MKKIIIDDELYELKQRVNHLLNQSAKLEYLDTGDCLDVLNLAKRALRGVARQPELPLEEAP